MPRRKPKPSKGQGLTAWLKKLAPGRRSKPKPGRAGRKASASGAVILAGAGFGALAATRRRRSAGEQAQPEEPGSSPERTSSEAEELDVGACSHGKA